jgi:hypothetical protein
MAPPVSESGQSLPVGRADMDVGVDGHLSPLGVYCRILHVAPGCRAAAFGGIVFGQQSNGPRAGMLLWPLACSVLVLFLPTAGNNISNARLQLAVDRENTAMLDYAAREIQHNDRLFVNLPSENAYIHHIDLHLALRDRADIQVAPLDLEHLPPGKYNVAALELEHQPLFFVRLGTYEQGAKKWNAAFLKRAGQE